MQVSDGNIGIAVSDQGVTIEASLKRAYVPLGTELSLPASSRYIIEQFISEDPGIFQTEDPNNP